MASTFRFVWDGNVLLHETFKKDNSENTELTTWVFEGFVPTAKLVNGKAYSIISDHLGTPIMALDSEGNEVWNRQLDIYGRVKREIKASSLGDDVRPFIPFLYQGQYYDFETNLAYNRYRYYSPETGGYISQDPIGLAGGNPTLYGYVKDSNWWVDVFGLDCISKKAAFRKAKRDAGIPMTQQPYKVNKIPMTDRNGKIIPDKNKQRIMTTEYHFINTDGKKIVIQDHSAGHHYSDGKGEQGPHYNVRPIENTRTGSVANTQDHYSFPSKKK